MKEKLFGMRNILVRGLIAAYIAASGFSPLFADKRAADRDWVDRRIDEAIANIVIRSMPDRIRTGDTTNTSWRTSFGLDATNTLTATIYIPTNPALFVAWSTVPEIPAYTFYAKVPGLQMYANATNSLLPTITYTVTNWTETATNSAGAAVSASFKSTRWRATDSGGGKWFTGYLDGDTILCMATNTAKYIVIRSSTVTDAAARTLRGSYEPQVVRDFRLLSLFALTAYADVDTESGGGSLGYHQGLAMGVALTDNLGRTYYVDDGKDHQYDPYGGVAYADLKEGESGYLSSAAFSDPENWGYSFPLEVVLENGTKLRITKRAFMNSPEWQEFMSNLELPDPPQKDETPTITDDPGEHDCKVFDAEGNHIGCVCDNVYCKYCPNCNLEYKVTWSDGSQTTKTLSFVGAQHNLQQVVCDANGVLLPSEAGGGGCVICWAADNAANGTHFCGNETGTRGWGDENVFTHSVNSPSATGRENCGCMCAHYNDSSDVIPTTMHVHPSSSDEGHGEHCGQNSYCWCFCRREHNGVIAGNDAENTCPGHCLTCGAFHTVDGVEINGVHPTPMPYRVTDGEGDDISLEDHMPSESRCGCKCGAISPGSEATRDLLWSADSFHNYEDDGNGNHTSCSCKCGMKHQTVNNTGHCPKVCTLCGRVDEEQTIDGNTVNVPRAATWEDHTPDGEHCGCQCYQHQDGFHGEEEGVCGYDGTEKGPNESQMWHKRNTGAFGTYCCCECGVYSDHRARDGSHMSWFVPGQCENFCGGINAFGQVCGKLKDEDRDAKESDHTPSDTACGCKCGEVTSETDTEEFHAARDATYSCMCKCNKFHTGEWVNKSCGANSWRECSENESHIDGTEAHEYANGHPDASVHYCKCAKQKTAAHVKSSGTVRYEPGWIITPKSCTVSGCGWTGEDRTPCTHSWGEWVLSYQTSVIATFVRSCSICGAIDTYTKFLPDLLTCDTNNNIHIPATEVCGCKCGKYGQDADASTDIGLHKWADTEDAYGVQICLCKCGRYHEQRSASTYMSNLGKVCGSVCAYCKNKSGTGLDVGRADDSLHTPCTSSDGHCGCKCGFLTADGTNLEKFHVRKGGTCRCLGSDGNGGAWHFRMPRPDGKCQKICACTSEFGGEHCVASSEKERIQPKLAAVDDHTKVSGSMCGCECRKYYHTNWASWINLANFHNSNPNNCGCFCTHASESQINPYHKKLSENDCECMCSEHNVISHVWLTGKCKCQCQYHDKQHRKVNNGKCTAVCHGECGEASLESKKKSHTPHESQCGCECRNFLGPSYPDSEAFHKKTGGNCMCDCGECHIGFVGKNGCPNVCAVCEMNRERTKSDESIHSFGNRCVCGCGDYSRPHAWSGYAKSLTDTYTCEICEETIRVYTYTRHCQRDCNATQSYTGEEGHNAEIHGEAGEEPPSSPTICTEELKDGTTCGTEYTGDQCPNRENHKNYHSGDDGGSSGDGGLDDILYGGN